ASENQIRNAKTIIGISKTLNLGKQGALIGLMTALAESSILDHASAAVPVSETFPHDDEPAGDHDSVGVFQQRAYGGWAPVPGSKDLTKAVSYLMNSGLPTATEDSRAAYSAEAFFAMPAGKTDNKALVNVQGWETMDPWMAAQKVQVSFDPTGSNYKRQLSTAQSFLDKYYDSTQAVPLPVPLAGGAHGGSGGASGSPAAGDPCAAGAVGSLSGCVNPFNEGFGQWGLARTDQGVDYIPHKILPVRAICDGVITDAEMGTGWGGKPGGWVSYKLTSGPTELIGKCIYVAEQIFPSVHVGQKVKAGETIAQAHPDPVWTEWGWTSYPTGRHQPSTPYGNDPDGTAEPGGKAFARFLRALGAKTQMDPGPGPMWTGTNCPDKIKGVN
ncbi:MAG TPA: hypothetical protein VHQ86_01855, partial [Candidatus Saccharimonadia bacterium]|nr:hypothetical protein [Candidatus Saccharimonadia bacterium]